MYNWPLLDIDINLSLSFLWSKVYCGPVWNKIILTSQLLNQTSNSKFLRNPSSSYRYETRGGTDTTSMWCLGVCCALCAKNVASVDQFHFKLDRRSKLHENCVSLYKAAGDPIPNVTQACSVCSQFGSPRKYRIYNPGGTSVIHEVWSSYRL